MLYDVYFCGDELPTYKAIPWDEAVRVTTGLPRWMDFDIVEHGDPRYTED